jgi:hypothetical protein
MKLLNWLLGTEDGLDDVQRVRLREQGRAAWQAQQRRNPYQMGTATHREWKAGYLEEVKEDLRHW